MNIFRGKITIGNRKINLCILTIFTFLLSAVIFLWYFNDDEKTNIEIQNKIISIHYKSPKRTGRIYLFPYLFPRKKLFFMHCYNSTSIFRVDEKKKKIIIKIEPKFGYQVEKDKSVVALNHKNIVKIHKIMYCNKIKGINKMTNVQDAIHKVFDGKIDFSMVKDELCVTWMEYLEIEVSYSTFYRCEKEIAFFLYQILKAVYCLHMNDIIHCDIKLDNILAQIKDNAMNFKLIDFNVSLICKNRDHVLTGITIGTFYYMPPETYDECIVSYKTDIYAYGALGYYLLNDLDDEIKNLYKKDAGKCQKCKLKNIIINIKKCKNCQDLMDCENCRACLQCIKCWGCPLCRSCLDCVVCKKCALCKKAEKNIDLAYDLLNIHGKKINAKNKFLEAFIIECLQDFKQRPDIIALLNSKNTRMLFQEYWNIDDFPGLKTV